ncbi:cell division protein FtsW [Niastella yeongjuensis]|uniref:Probable peptidoglycan glycosyltransferase FtsW n=1 Tax=Niastella yeongjuensis TaxID=354355 RepID=A0A1V9EPA9_9BACT|nr:FtsW/RodA/SpoVE family cell cycle protein [Niastella yeongjuensis]OQP47774.1 cell division protein FtsW [Niastella yeongjuensis]SEP45339.1 cell division protein FtsW [Niastella yeongjuensis]
MTGANDISLKGGNLPNGRSAAGLLSKTRGDKVIWAIVVVLAVVSMLAVYSSTGLLAYKYNRGNTEVYLFKQVVFTAVGLGIIYFSHRVNYTLWSRVARILFMASVPLLIYTLFFGLKLNEGSRWIRLPIINLTFQTSDLAKLSLFMFLSRLLSKKQEVIKDFKKGFIPVIIPVGIICVLIAPANLSTALLVGATSMLLLFIGRVSTKHLLMTIGVALIPVAFLVMLAIGFYDKKEEKCAELPFFLHIARVPTWISRVQNFIYDSKQVDKDENYQINQSKIAIAKGGLLGLGPGNSQTRNFLPHPYSDFIFAIIIEEYGLAGGGFLIFIYLLFLLRSIKIFKKCPYAFGAFLALGLSFTLVIQALINMAVTVNLFPVTGVTLPLVSMGGSSFLFTCLAIGIILSVARNVEQLEAPSNSPGGGEQEKPSAKKQKDDIAEEEVEEEAPVVKKAKLTKKKEKEKVETTEEKAAKLAALKPLTDIAMNDLKQGK